MSWQSYVDDHLIASGAVTKAAIVGVGGETWATSAGFSVSDTEAKALVTGFTDASGLQAGGIMVGGEKYMFIKCESGKEIIGKKVRRTRACPPPRGPGGGRRQGRASRQCVYMPLTHDACRFATSLVASTCVRVCVFAQGAAGMCAFKGNTFVMISVHDESIVPGACSAATGKIADYLIEQGM